MALELCCQTIPDQYSMQQVQEFELVDQTNLRSLPMVVKLVEVVQLSSIVASSHPSS